MNQKVILLVVTGVLWNTAGCTASHDKRGTAGAGTGGAGVTTTSSQCLSIVNGKPTSNIPSVVRLVTQESGGSGFCTGTFISSVAVITAAHCLSDDVNGGMSVTFDATISNSMEGVAALKAFTLGSRGKAVDTNSSDAIAKDLAIALFPPGTAPSIMAIGASRPALGASIMSVGFGLKTLPDEPEDPNYNGSKYYGSEKVVQGQEEANIYTGAVTAQQSIDAAGEEVLNSYGDSGGPMILDNRLVGTLSSGGKTTNEENADIYLDIFVDINSATSKKLIDLANENGAGIPAAGTTSTTDTLNTAAKTSSNCP